MLILFFSPFRNFSNPHKVVSIVQFVILSDTHALYLESPIVNIQPHLLYLFDSLNIYNRKSLYFLFKLEHIKLTKSRMIGVKAIVRFFLPF